MRVGSLTKAGYRATNIQRRSVFIHRLVYECCHQVVLPTEQQVHHIDENKDNNQASNLQLVTRAQHNQLTFAGKKQRQLSTSKGRPVLRTQHGVTAEFPSIREAERQTPGATLWNIQNAIKGTKKTHAGFTWKLKPTEELPNEEWKEIAGLPRYRVSSMGRVKGANGRVTSGRVNAYGYCVVTIANKRYQVHRLVAAAYHPPSTLPTVDHINRNRQDNRATNLRWASYATQNENRDSRVAV